MLIKKCINFLFLIFIILNKLIYEKYFFKKGSAQKKERRGELTGLQ